MRYRSQHTEADHGLLSAQSGESTEVFYVLWTAECAPGEQGPFSPVSLQVDVKEIQFLKDPDFEGRHANETLTLMGSEPFDA